MINQTKIGKFTHIENKLKEDFVVSIIKWKPATEHFIKNNSKAPPVNTAAIIIIF